MLLNGWLISLLRLVTRRRVGLRTRCLISGHLRLKLPERHIVFQLAFLLDAILKLWRQGKQRLGWAVIHQICHR
ncbi:hypothetical protein D3C76_1411550 [compost metagenome]